METRTIATGLKFPEGPIAMADGSIVLVEIARGTLSKVTPDGTIEVVAELGGGPNGAALGPGGAVYVCNNGGFIWYDLPAGGLAPGDRPDDYSGGRIERVDLNTGDVTVLYTECNGSPLNGPNDIVFDAQGGFYFTDLGKFYGRQQDRGAVYYAKADGSLITELIFPLYTPNGIGLSPDEQTLYVAETITGRVWAYPIEQPGKLKGDGAPGTGACLAGLPGHQLLDSMAVDSLGNVCVATLVNGGITSISPDGETVTHTPMKDALTTNICFGGEGLKKAFITLSSIGELVACDWPVAGLPLNFLNK